MAYIDVDKLAEKICNFQAIDEDAANKMIWLLRTFPTADVAPKSEVEELFVEIENVINDELQNNYKVLPQFEFSNELWNKMSGRIEALEEICDFIAELKKRNTRRERDENFNVL